MLWLPGAKRPVIGLRCGISAVIKSNEKNRSFSTKASLNLRTNDLSNVLIYALDTRCSKGIYGDWPAGGHMSFHRSTFVASGTQEEILQRCKDQRLDFVVIVELAKDSYSSDARIRVVDVHGVQEPIVSNTIAISAANQKKSGEF
jgi:hypothetical protein